MKKSWIFTIHSVAGLLSGLFILVMSLSGSLLLFHDELDRLQYPVVEIEANKPQLPLDSCYNRIREKYPFAQVSNCHIPEQLSRPWIFSIYDSSFRDGKEALKLFLHPQTGSLLKAMGSRSSFTNWMDTLHGSLHLGKTGEWLLGILALVFLLSILTGLILYRKNLIPVLLFRKRMFRRANLHQVVGVFAFLFNLMIAITGFWMQRYVFKKDFFKSYDYTPVIRPAPPLFFSLDSSFSILKDKHPAFTAYVVYFTQSKKGKTVVYGSRSGNSFIHSKKFADMILLDSAGAIASTAFINERTPADRYDIISSQVHYGQYGGLTVKIIYLFFGLTGGILAITGFLLWVRKKRSIRANTLHK